MEHSYRKISTAAVLVALVFAMPGAAAVSEEAAYLACGRAPDGSPTPLATEHAVRDTCASYHGDWTVSNQRLCTGTTTSGGPLPAGLSGVTPAVFAGKTPYVSPLPGLPSSPPPAFQGPFAAVNAVVAQGNGHVASANGAIADAWPAGSTPDLCGTYAPARLVEDADERV